MLERQLVQVISLMSQVLNLFYNDVATATEQVTVLHLKKERKSARPSIKFVVSVKEKDIFELFVNQDQNPQQSPMKSSQLRMLQLLVARLWLISAP